MKNDWELKVIKTAVISILVVFVLGMVRIGWEIVKGF